VTHFELLPYIDRYLKKQLLKDKTIYTHQLYGDRVFTDFYHRNFQIEDSTAYNSKPLDLNLRHKVGLSWHIGLGNMVGDLTPFPRITGSLKSLLPPSYNIEFINPHRQKNLDMMARGRRFYERETVRFHREKLDSKLDRIKHRTAAITGHVPVRQYKYEMSNAKLVISPFGWGEIGVRDFEAFIYGAALIKPDVSHMETWPDTFIPGITYMPIKWNFEDLEATVERLLVNTELRIDLAHTAQDMYRKMLSDDGMEEFCDWFVKQISVNSNSANVKEDLTHDRKQR